jgi:hypothetical protein
MGGFARGTYLLKYYEGPDANKLTFSKTVTISY